MKKSTLIGLCLTVALAFALAGCGSDDPTGPVNSAPTITAGPTAQPAAIGSDQTTLLSVTATDGDGDDLTYTWSSDDGTFNGTGSLVSYTPGDVAIETVQTAHVIISDGNNGSVTGTVDVTVSPAVLIGKSYRIRLNSLNFVYTNCDGIFDDDIEAYWNIQAGGVSAVRTETDVSFSSGQNWMITTGWSETDILFDGTGAIAVTGTLHDYDTSSGDDLIGNWNLSYNNSNIAPGTFNVSGGHPTGEDCNVVLNFTIEYVADVYGTP